MDRWNLQGVLVQYKEQCGEQDRGGVGGCGVHLSPWIHQEYTFRHRSSCRTPADSRHEYLTRFDPWVRKFPWRRKWEPIPAFSPEKFHVQRSLVSYSPWGCKESDMTE